ncbi:hypothetical protein JCM17845_11020 [Iodidimonas gelatinilytica]|uniref:DUF2207 domain-containing protein n=1 Tax=Iodidimonas gelatinilytica TaxID=1236966 RepID=A0A5A7MZT9_9PROT|nr:DUF2207 domain-containing protein [Iodidimonas gelatinilytica]GER00479.1 hypothetical protein JCM17845_11020 [Iodidimonas gelatinilytica]
MRNALFAFGVFFGLFNMAASALSQEQIVRYDSQITVLPSGRLDVVETIIVDAEGKRIKRGIFRDFQTDYQGDHGRSTVDFDIGEVLLDGAPVPWKMIKAGAGKRLRIGDGEKTLEPGRYRYEIHFQTDRQLIFFPERDELVYQPISYGWEFPIQSARATVILPENAVPTALRVSAGASGAAEGGAKITQPQPNRVVFEADGPLAARHGMTVALTWPAGFVARPTELENAIHYLGDNIGVLLALAGVLVVLCYYLWAWHRVGRDPKGGVIIAQYGPPKSLSPAAARYLVKQGWDDAGFSAAIVSLAVKGALDINEDQKKVFTLSRRHGAWRPNNLSAGEVAILDALFAQFDHILVDKKNHKRLATARTAHRRALAREHLGTHFKRNLGHFVLGAGLSLGFAIPSLMLAKSTALLMIIALVVLFVLNPLFFWLLHAPTLKGRKLLDEIEGFKRYLSVAEKDRLNFHNPPEKTPELFEAYLPMPWLWAWGRNGGINSMMF